MCRLGSTQPESVRAESLKNDRADMLEMDGPAEYPSSSSSLMSQYNS